MSEENLGNINLKALERGEWLDRLALDSCTYFRIVHREYGPISAIVVGPQAGLSRAELETAFEQIRKCDVTALRKSHAVLEGEDGQCVVVTEAWSKEDSIRQLIAKRGRGLSKSELDAEGLRLVRSIAEGADAAALECGPLQLDTRTLTVEGAQGDVLAPSGRLRISPWNIRAMRAKAGIEGEAAGADEPNATVIESFPDGPVEGQVQALGRLVYELLGGNPRNFRKGSFRKIPELSASALDLMQDLCDGYADESQTCVGWVEQFEASQGDRKLDRRRLAGGGAVESDPPPSSPAPICKDPAAPPVPRPSEPTSPAFESESVPPSAPSRALVPSGEEPGTPMTASPLAPGDESGRTGSIEGGRATAPSALMKKYGVASSTEPQAGKGTGRGCANLLVAAALVSALIGLLMRMVG